MVVAFFALMRHSASLDLNLVYMFPFKLHLRLFPAGLNIDLNDPTYLEI